MSLVVRLVVGVCQMGGRAGEWWERGTCRMGRRRGVCLWWYGLRWACVRGVKGRGNGGRGVHVGRAGGDGRASLVVRLAVGVF